MKIYDKKKKRDEDFDVDLTNIKKHNSENLIYDGNGNHLKNILVY